MPEPKIDNVLDDVFGGGLKVVPPTYQVHRDMSKWARIGGGYYLLTSKGWRPRRASEFDDEFDKKDRGKIKTYYDFKVEPNHVNYKMFETDADGIYVNWYRPLSYKAEKGDWSAYEKVIKHLSQGEDYGYEFIMTWLWLKYIHPKLPVPFVLFVGQKGSGKSTWENVCKGLFEQNFWAGFANEALKDNNIHLFGKLIMHIREKARSEKHSTNEMQKLKARVTAPDLQFRALYHDLVTGPNYMAGSLDSNDTDNPLSIEGENRRFAAFDVPPLSEDVRTRSIFTDLEDQAKHFAWYLINEFKPSGDLGNFDNDLYFFQKYIHTSASKRIQKNSANADDEGQEAIAEYVDKINDILDSARTTKPVEVLIPQANLVHFIREDDKNVKRVHVKAALKLCGGINTTHRPKGNRQLLNKTGNLTTMKKATGGFLFEISPQGDA